MCQMHECGITRGRANDAGVSTAVFISRSSWEIAKIGRMFREMWSEDIRD